MKTVSVARKLLRDLHRGDPAQFQSLDPWMFCPHVDGSNFKWQSVPFRAQCAAWQSLRVRALMAAWKAARVFLPESLTYSAVRSLRVLIACADAAFKSRHEGLAYARNRATKKQKGRDTLPSTALFRHDSRTPQRPGDDGPGISKDPRGHAKREATRALEDLGLRGRKFTDVRTAVLFGLGIVENFDAKAALRLAMPANVRGRSPHALKYGYVKRPLMRAIDSQGRAAPWRTNHHAVADAFLTAFERREKTPK